MFRPSISGGCGGRQLGEFLVEEHHCPAVYDEPYLASSPKARGKEVGEKVEDLEQGHPIKRAGIALGDATQSRWSRDR